MSLTSGTRLGPYEILAPIGAGGMGEVYRARDARLGREVAIKVLPASFSQDRERLRRFEQEAKTAGALNHPNLVTVYDLGVEEECPYLVMELLEGDTLRDRIHEGALPLRKAVDYALQIAYGVSAAHEKGIIHRDLKPENTFITRDGRLKILDFGLAKQAISGSIPEVSRYVTESHTAAGMIVGTVGYISPEQIRGLAADERSDIFAFGAIFYEMLSGVRAFHAESSVETMTQILTMDPFVAEVTGTFPPALHRILSRCLEKNPAERFRSMRDLAFSIEALSDASGTTTAPRDLPILAAPPTFKRLTFHKGYVSSARIAPDGSTVVYSAAWNGEPLRAYMARPDSLDSLPLSVPDGDLLSVSGTGEMALLLERTTEVGYGQAGILARAPLIGGTPRKLLENVSAADWMPDGKSLAVVRRHESHNILEFPVGNEVYRTGGWLSKIRVSRSGKLLAFADHALYGDDAGAVCVIDGSGNKRILSGGWTAVQGVAWSPDDREIWFSAADHSSSERSLRAVTLEGQVRLVFRAPSSLALMDISPTGRVLLARDSPRRETKVLADDGSERDLTWLSWSFPMTLTRDGGQLLFIEQGAQGLYQGCVRDTKGSPPLVFGPCAVLEFSPDENYVLSVPGFPITAINLLPVGLGSEQSIRLDHFQASWPMYRDKNSLLSLGSLNGQPSALHILTVDNPPQPIGIKGPEIPTFWIHHSISPDGKSMIGWDGRRMLRIYSLEEDVSRAVPGAIAGEVSVMWSADGNKIYSYLPGGLSIAIHCTDLNTGEKTLFKQIRPPDSSGVHGLGPAVLSADLKICVYSFRRSLAELYLAEGI